MTTEDKQIPILDALRTPSGHSLVIWCTSCGCHHMHGAGDRPVGEGGGHRVAHCARRDGIYARTGYELREVGMLTKENVVGYFGPQAVRGLRRLMG